MTDAQTEILMDIRERCARMETKQDAQAEATRDLKVTVDAQDERIGKLEGGYRLLASLGAIFVAIMTFFQDFFVGRLLS